MSRQPWYKKFAEKQRREGKNRIILDRAGEEPYLERFYLHSRWWTLGLFRVVVHRFWKSDDDGAFHSHPWLFWGTRILEGGYTEHTPKKIYKRKPGNVAFKSGWATHWVELPKDKKGKDKECWTLFLMGPKIKGWGFIDPVTGEEVPWTVYLKNKLKIENK